jgi:hypothetical protein
MGGPIAAEGEVEAVEGWPEFAVNHARNARALIVATDRQRW